MRQKAMKKRGQKTLKTIKKARRKNEKKKNAKKRHLRKKLKKWRYKYDTNKREKSL